MILAVAEQRQGKLNRASWEVIAAAQQAGGPINVAVLGQGVAAVAQALAAASVEAVTVVDSPALAEYTADGHVAALQALVGQLSPDVIFLAHTYETRDFAPALASRLERPLVTDVVALKAQDDGPVYTRPVFQGKLSADVQATGPAPHLVTFQIGAFRADTVARGATPAAVKTAEVAIDAGSIRQKPEAPFKEARQAVDLSQAERIVAVGRGIKGQEHIAMAQQLAQALGAELAASRPICDAGWLPMDRRSAAPARPSRPGSTSRSASPAPSSTWSA